MRGKKAVKRDIPADSVYNSVLVTKFINYLMLDGKKTVAEKNVYTAMEKLAADTKMEPLDALKQSLDNIKPKIEVKSRRVGGANYQVPVAVSEERQLSLAIRWILDVCRKNRGNRTFAERLEAELFAAFKKEGEAFKKREDTHKMADANKAFSHLTW